MYLALRHGEVTENQSLFDGVQFGLSTSGIYR